MNLEQELQRKSFAGRVGMMVCRFGRVLSPAGFGEASGLCRKNEGGFRLVLSRGEEGGCRHSRGRTKERTLGGGLGGVGTGALH